MLPDVTVVNVIASTKSDRQIDLELLSTQLKYVDYEPEIFPGLIYRRRNPKTTIIIFSTGKIVSIGAKSEKNAKESILSTISEITRIEGEKIRVGKIKIENVVAVSDIGYEIDVKNFANHKNNAAFRPRRFSGVIYRTKDNMVVLIFRSGKLISLGAKSEQQAKSAIYSTYRTLIELGCIIGRR